MNEFPFEITGTIDGYGWQRSNVRYMLNKMQGKPVRCRITSPGGDVSEAIAIAKLFEDHGDVTVEFVGFSASAATFLAFGAKSIEMHDDALWLCHKCSIPVNVYGMLNSDKIDKTIEELKAKKNSTDVVDLVIAKKYLARCEPKGKTLRDVLDLMAENKWLDAETALAWGFIDRVLTNGKKLTNEYREMMVENCVALKLPTPVFKTEEEPKTEDVAERIINGIKSFFKPKEEPKTEITNQHQSIMNKDFTTVNSLLGVEGFSVTDEKVTLTVAQLKAINDKLGEAAANQAAVDDAVKALDGLSDNIKNITGLTNKVNAVKIVLDKVPVGIPAGHNIPDKVENCSDVAKDPVNEYVKGQD